MKIRIAHLDKAKVLIALYNYSKPIGMGNYSQNPDYIMDIKEAWRLLKEKPRLDYINGRAIKVDLRSDDFETTAYDNLNGQNAAEKALKPLNDEYTDKFIREKCTPKLLQELCATAVLANKARFFTSLHKVPNTILDAYPELEVQPLRIFTRRIKKLLDESAFLKGEKEDSKKLYATLNSTHPYNAIHAVVLELRQRAQVQFLPQYAANARDLCNKIISFMTLYTQEQKVYLETVKEIKSGLKPIPKP